jgi:hypothetical protein
METDRVRIRPRISMGGCEQSMRNSFKADASDNQATFASVATSSRFMLLLICSMSVLSSCANPPAPSPTPNPHPQQTVKLKITVEKGSEVNRVKVASQWVVSDLTCAPVIWPAGNTRVKQVAVPEQVDKMGSNYVATIVLDRFLPDKCQWVNGGLNVQFFHGDRLLSGVGVNGDVLSGKLTLGMTCLTKLLANAGTCGLRDEESFYKSEDKNAFNATVELLK